MILEIKLDLFGDVCARWEDTGNDLACFGFAKVNDILGVRRDFRRTTMAVDPESKFSWRRKGFRFQSTHAAFLITSASHHTLQDGGLRTVRAFSRLKGPFCFTHCSP